MCKVSQWPNLAPDLLNEIARRMYYLDDYIRLRYICKEWYLLLPQTPQHRNPWLVLPFDHNNFNTRNLDGKQIYHLIRPDMRNNFFRGSSYGYLIIVMSSSGAVKMLNPFTDSQFDLPPISTFPNIAVYNPDKERYAIKNVKTNDIMWTQKRSYVHEVQLVKVITSSPPNHEDLTAVAIYGHLQRLAYCKSGERRWVDILHDRAEFCGFQDVIIHKGKIYAVDWIPRLSEFDMKTGVPLRGFIREVAPPPQIYNLYALKQMYLIGCPNGGGLLMLVRNFICFARNRNRNVQRRFHWTLKFDLFMVNNEEIKWSRIESLGDYAALVGHNSSHVMVPDEWKGNHIYFADNLSQFGGLRWGAHDFDIIRRYGGHDIGVLDLEYGITNRPFPHLTSLYPPPVWLLPHLDFSLINSDLLE